MARRRNNRDLDALPLAEEVATIAKRDIHTGSVRVRTETETFDDIVRSTLRSGTVEVTRVTVDREVAEAPKIRTEGDVTVIPVLEEILVVEKRLVLKEEIHIRRITRSEDVEAAVTLRRQRAVIERLDAAGKPETETTTRKQNERLPTR